MSLGLMVFGSISVILGAIIMLTCTIPKLTDIYYKQVLTGQSVGIRFFGIGFIAIIAGLIL